MRIRSAILSALPFAAAPARADDAATALEKEVIELFDCWREPLLRYLLSLGLAVPDSEEIVQDVFLSLFQHLQRGGANSNLRGWLFRVAHNLGLKRRYRTLRGCKTMDADAEERVRDPAPGPEERVIRGQTHRRLEAVLQALPEQDRRCLRLRAEGLRYREIAEVLEISLGAVSLSLGRSLARIARAAER